MIHERHWGEFVKQPESAVVSIVQEFYANAKEATDFVVQVRGKPVSFTSASINEYYQLEGFGDEEDEFTDYYNKDLNLTDVIKHLCKPGAKWKSRDQQGAVTFPHKELSRYGKAWYTFICAKLMPSTHLTDVTQERAVLLYAIVTGKSVDVGQVIHSSLRYALQGGSTSGLLHPSLITGLCKKAKVTWDADEVVQPPKAVIDLATIKRFKIWDGGDSHPRGAGFIIGSNPPDGGGHVQPPPESFYEYSQPAQPSRQGASSSSSHSQMDFLIAEMKELRKENAVLRRSQEEILRVTRRQFRRVDQLTDRFDTFVDYSTDFNATISTVFNAPGVGFNQGPFRFPNPPVFPEYTPDTEEESDDDDLADDDDESEEGAT